MKRYRLSSLLFLIAIAALTCALFVQQRQARVREQQLRAELEAMRAEQRQLELVTTIDQMITERTLAAVRETAARASADKASDQPAAPVQP